MKLKWTKFGLDAYKKTGEQMKAMGFKPLRDIQDVDGHSALTFWSSRDACVIQQTWADTGDVALYRSIGEAELEAMISAVVVSD